MGRKGQALGVNRKLQGKYANYFEVGHNAFEFLLDFGQIYPEEDSEHMKFHTRIIINPTYAKDLLEILRKSIKEYESNLEYIHGIKGSVVN
jgi:hypothetical protein